MFVISKLTMADWMVHLRSQRGTFFDGSDFMSAMPESDAARRVWVSQNRDRYLLLSDRPADPVDRPQANGLPPMQLPFHDLIPPVCWTVARGIGPDGKAAFALTQRRPSMASETKVRPASRGAARSVGMRHAAALLAMMAFGTASPALADKQAKEAKKADAAAIAAIRARIEQLRADPQSRKCLGADAVTCVASLSFHFTLTTPPLWMGGGFKLPGPVQRDINGRTMSATMDFLIKFNPKDRYLINDSMVGAKIGLGDGEHVDSVDFDLKENPLLAQTEAEWDKTHVFELATAVLGPTCIGTDRVAFYRRYDAIQRQDSSSDRVDLGYRHSRNSSSTSGDTKICGVTMHVTAIRGYARSIGSYGGAMLTFRL